MRRILPAVFFLFFHWYQPGPYNLHRGNLEYEKGNYRRALLFYQRAMEEGEGPEARFNMGCALYMMGRYREAEKAFKAYLSARKDYRGFYNLGNVYFQRGLYERAYEMYKKALIKNPDFYPAKVNLELSLKMMEGQKPSPSPRVLPDAIMEFLREKEKEVFRKKWRPKGYSRERDW